MSTLYPRARAEAPSEAANLEGSPAGRRVTSCRVEALILGNHVWEALLEHGPEVVALLIGERERAGYDELGSVIGGPLDNAAQRVLIVAQAGQDRHQTGAGGDSPLGQAGPVPAPLFGTRGERP